VAAAAGLLGLAWPLVRWGEWSFQSGGWVGVLLAWGLPLLLNRSGAALTLGLVLLISLMGATRLSYLGLLSLLGRTLASLGSLVWHRRREPEPSLLAPADLRRQSRWSTAVAAKPRS